MSHYDTLGVARDAAAAAKLAENYEPELMDPAPAQPDMRLFGAPVFFTSTGT